MTDRHESLTGTAPFPLFQRYPRLERTLPRRPLSDGPSPVARMSHLEKGLGSGQVWIKNDGLYGRLYGGNKPRKLEFILADAQAKGASVIITGGALGTNHGLATALYGAEVGLRVVIFLTYELPTAEAARNLCWMQSAGADLRYVGSIPQAFIMAPVHALRQRMGRPRRVPYLVGPGASTPLGALGYVNAALELAQQVSDGLLPEPEAIYVPLGSAGTAAGLLLGLKIGGLRSRLVAVAVTRAPTAWAFSVARLANASARLLERRAGQKVPRVRSSDVVVDAGWLGGGFGKPLAAGQEAMSMLEETEGLKLEPVYTAKTMAALIGAARRGALPKAVLYWHTYNAVASAPQFGPEDCDKLPLPLRQLCRGALRA